MNDEERRKRLYEEVDRQQAAKDQNEAEIERLGIADLIDVAEDQKVGDDFFGGDTDEERDEWVKRGGNFGPGYGLGGSRQQQEDGSKKQGSDNSSSKQGGSKKQSNSNQKRNPYDTINLTDSDIEEITSYILTGNDDITGMVYVLPGFLFESHIDLNSSEKLILKLSNDDVMIKNLNDIYLRGSRGEDLPKGDAEILGAKIVEKIKRVFRRRKNDALSRLPVDVGNGLYPYIRNELQANVVEVLSPKIFNTKELGLVVAQLSSKTIRYATVYVNKKEVEGVENVSYDFVYGNTIINAIPTKIVRYENPTSDTVFKYDITFESFSDQPIRIIGTIEEILSLLRSDGRIYNFKLAEGVFTAILNAYHREERMEIKSQLKSGFYLVDGKIEAHGYAPQNYTKEDIVESINLLNNLAGRYKRPEIFPSVIKWGLIAPFSYSIKQLDDKTLCLPIRYDHGETHGGKTTNGQIVLKMWRIHDLDHEKPFNSVNTEARMGYAISESTFPMLINEVPDLNNPKYSDMVEAIKNSVYDKTFRSRVEGPRLNKYHHFPALRQFYFTGNPCPPDDTAFQRRIFPTYYSLDDVPIDKKEFEALLNKEGHKLGTLTDFAANFILNNNECLKTDWRQLTKEILTAFYKEAEMEAPAWVNLLSEEDYLEDVIEAQKQVVRGALRNLIEGCHSRNYHSLKNPISDDNGSPKYQQNDTFQDRLNFCLDKDLISFLKKKNNKIIILHDVVTELKNCKVSSLPQLQSMIGGHSQHTVLRIGIGIGIMNGSRRS